MNLLSRAIKALRRSAQPGAAEVKLLSYANELDITCLFTLFGLLANAGSPASSEQIQEIELFIERQVPSKLQNLARDCFQTGQTRQAEKSLITHYAFQLYWNKNERWLEPLQVLSSLLVLAFADREYSALEEYIIDCTRSTLGIHTRSYRILRDTLAQRYNIKINFAGESFAGAVDWAALGAERFRKHTQRTQAKNQGTSTENNSRLRLKAYSVLNLEPGAPNQSIKESYRKLVKLYHPDILQSGAGSDRELKEAIARFCQIQEAYEILCDQP